jgi:hypothetical protein
VKRRFSMEIDGFATLRRILSEVVSKVRGPFLPAFQPSKTYILSLSAT